MKFKIDHDLHIHSYLSSCSRDPEQTATRILKHAIDDKLTAVAVTDHYWDGSIVGATAWYKPQDFEHISKIKPLPSSNGIKFLFGCETEMNKEKTIAIPLSRFDDFDFVIIPTTHMHMEGFTISAEDSKSIERRAQVWIDRFDKVLDMPFPFKKVGIAHLCSNHIAHSSREDYLKILKLIPDSELERLFAKAAEIGVGIELNLSDMSFNDSEADTVLHPFKIAKYQGCRFYLGSDAHHPNVFNRFNEIFARAVNLLDLNESDKFIIEKARMIN